MPGDDGDDAPLDEEISSLEAIFCSPGEIEVGAGGARSHSREVVIRLGSKGGKEEAPAGEVRARTLSKKELQCKCKCHPAR